MAKKTSREESVSLIRKFNAERDWDRFHGAKNLACSIAIESGELLEELQWDDPAYDALRADSERMERIRMELADIQIYILNLADHLGVDLDRAVRDKLAENERRYPSKLCRGRSDKHHAYKTASRAAGRSTERV